MRRGLGSIAQAGWQIPRGGRGSREAGGEVGLLASARISRPGSTSRMRVRVQGDGRWRFDNCGRPPASTEHRGGTAASTEHWGGRGGSGSGGYNQFDRHTPLRDRGNGGRGVEQELRRQPCKTRGDKQAQVLGRLVVKSLHKMLGRLVVTSSTNMPRKVGLPTRLKMLGRPVVTSSTNMPRKVGLPSRLKMLGRLVLTSRGGMTEIGNGATRKD
jgi:hypothetical protein